MAIIIKCVGAGCLLAAGFLFGSGNADKMKQRTLLFSKMIDAFSYLRNKMCVGEYTLPEAMGACNETFFSDAENTVFCLSKENLTDGKMSASQAWRDACSRCGEAAILGKEAVEKLSDFGVLFDSPDSALQQENLSRLIEALQEFRDESLKKEKRDGSLAVKLSVAACGMLAILLW